MGGFGASVVMLSQVSGLAFYIGASLIIALQVFLIIYLIRNLKVK